MGTTTEEVVTMGRPKQLFLPGLAPPRWWDHIFAFFLSEYVLQPDHFSRVKVVDKRFRPQETFRVVAGYCGTAPVTIKCAWLLKVETPHGTAEVEVSEQFYDLTRKGDVIRASYKLSRLYAMRGGIKAKLLR